MRSDEAINDRAVEKHDQAREADEQEPEQGIVLDLPEAAYHAHPSLSSTGARRILDSPARFRWEQQHPVVKDAFDVGKAVHAEVLGVGARLVVVDADSWRTKAAKEARDEARAAGQVPILSGDVEDIRAMAAAVLAHPVARSLFERPGAAEVSLFGIDEPTGTALRARFDFLPDPVPGVRTIAVDLKTTRSADPRKFGRSVAEFGYHQQEAWYRDLLGQVRGDDAAFVFVAVENTAPWLVSVCELTADAVAVGRSRNRVAVDLYASCAAADDWPGYGMDIFPIDLPAWAVYEAETVL